MVKVEMVMENAEPRKKNPLRLTDERCFFPDYMKEEIEELYTFEDLCEYKGKRNMVRMAYNNLTTMYTLDNMGKLYSGRIAIVAYDLWEDFPIWVAVGDDRFGNHLKIRFYEPYQQENRREFSWAVRKE